MSDSDLEKLTEKKYVVYALKLEDEKYYVGRTTEEKLEQRLKDHKNRTGSKWTSKYQVVELLLVYKNCSAFVEDMVVKELMAKKGIDNVRGGSYAQNTISDEKRKNIEI